MQVYFARTSNTKRKGVTAEAQQTGGSLLHVAACWEVLPLRAEQPAHKAAYASLSQITLAPGC